MPLSVPDTGRQTILPRANLLNSTRTTLCCPSGLFAFARLACEIDKVSRIDEVVAKPRVVKLKKKNGGGGLDGPMADVASPLRSFAFE